MTRNWDNNVMAICYLGIGSNLGHRRKNIKLALGKIGALKNTKVIKISRIIETEPVGGPVNQPKFLNAAAKINTGLTPPALLNNLKKIEKALGRDESGARFGPRRIDLDILLYGDSIVKTKNLEIPHPRMFEREFVLKPLREII